ncbi:hypothetical protein F4778DRAFT_91276 [Xylariomycetidae sp. FL2044]|nr:hypothetical protein F4778DRAFT_91276 [Xylariomycetidae sp. FL2044]
MESLTHRGQSAQDLGPRILASGWSLTALAAVFLGLRLFTKLWGRRGLWWDDGLLVGGWVLLVAYTAIVSHAISLGFGKQQSDIPKENRETTKLLVTGISATIGILATDLAKTSFAITLLKLSKGWTRAATWFLLVTLNIWSIFFCIFTYIKCDPVEKAWRPNIPGECWSRDVAQPIVVFVGAYSAFTDFALAFLPVAIIIRLQMKLVEKIGVVIAMSLGIVSGVIAIVRTVKLQEVASGQRPGEAGELVIWTAAEAATVIMATSIPVLRTLFRQIVSTYSNGKYYKNTSPSAPDFNQSRQHSTHITANRRPRPDEISDDDSDSSILRWNQGQEKNGASITRTDEISVNVGPAGESGYEMDRLPWDPNNQPRAI